MRFVPGGSDQRLCWRGDRGDCEPPVPEVVGKYMRYSTIASLRRTAAREREDAAADEADYEDGVADDLSVCCHGRNTKPQARPNSPLL